jgi:hypothetical protein
MQTVSNYFIFECILWRCAYSWQSSVLWLKPDFWEPDPRPLEGRIQKYLAYVTTRQLCLGPKHAPNMATSALATWTPIHCS